MSYRKLNQLTALRVYSHAQYMTAPDILSPFLLGPLLLPNRAVMAPMTRNRAGPGNVPGPLAATYYAQRASAGLIVSEATQVSPQGLGYPGTPGIHSAEQIGGWQRVTEAAHGAGGRIFLQLWHVGRISYPSLQPDGALPVAPSAIVPAGQAMTREGMQPFVTPRALDTAEIAGIVEDYRRGARNARQAGFDGVELHGANGYLVDQFLRDGANRRGDRYGGSALNRARFLFEVTEAIVGEWGAERVGVRLSPTNPFNSMTDSNPAATFSAAVGELNRLGLAYLHIVEPGATDPVAAGETPDIRFFRRLWRGPLIGNKGYDLARANAVLCDGAADLISFAALFLANPDLPERFRRSGPFNTLDRKTFYGGAAGGYTDYPPIAR